MHVSRGVTDFFVSLLEAADTARAERAARGGRVQMFSEAAPPPVGLAAVVHGKRETLHRVPRPHPEIARLAKFRLTLAAGKMQFFCRDRRPGPSCLLRGEMFCKKDQKALGRFSGSQRVFRDMIRLRMGRWHKTFRRRTVGLSAPLSTKVLNILHCRTPHKKRAWMLALPASRYVLPEVPPPNLSGLTPSFQVAAPGWG